MIISIIPAHRSDLWISAYDDYGPFYQNVCAFALTETQEVVPLVIDTIGQIEFAEPGRLIYSKDDPNDAKEENDLD